MKRAIAALLACVAVSAAYAHSASDAYLTLDASANAIHGRLDVALRDLHFVLGLDADGDGAITWGEVRKREATIARHAFDHLTVTGDGRPCTIEAGRQRVAEHADGTYVSLDFRIACKGRPARIALEYRLFFAVDPTHRGVAVFHSQRGTATALLSPGNARVEVMLR